MSCDGEESQIRVLLEETIATKFSDLRIVVAKTPRSCSGISQASAISEGFKEGHKALKHCTSEDFADLLLHDALVNIFKKYLEDNPNSDIKSDKRTTYIHGLLAMTYATQNVQTRTTVQHGYTHWGQKGGSLNFSRSWKHAEYQFPRQLDITFENLPIAVNFIRTEGMIPEAWYDEIGIYKIRDGDSVEKENGKLYNTYFA